MRINTLITLGASAAFGIMAIALAQGWIEGALENELASKRAITQTTRAPTVDLQPVLVADVPLNFGDILTQENLPLSCKSP